MLFFTGLHIIAHAWRFERSFISVNRLERRVSDLRVNDWIMDSGAFTRISNGQGHIDPQTYADQINRWAQCGNLLAAVCQDYMCEDFILDITGLTVADHQCGTVDNYLALRDLTETYVMPVLQGFEPQEYIEHLELYGKELKRQQWVGVGSVCKRNTDIGQIEHVLSTIKKKRPDLRLHGFGLKQTALRSGTVRRLLYSADSMAWSYAARKQGRNGNDWREAAAFEQRITSQQTQCGLFVQ